MEEAKAASYYDDLARKGEGAARFKQGLGFSSRTTNSGSTSARQGTFASSLSSTFVKATSPSKAQVFEKEIQVNNIRDKLRGKKDHANQSSKSRERSPEKHAVSSREKRHCSRSRSPTDKHRKRCRSRDRDRERKKHRRHRSRLRDRRRRRHRSRSRSSSRSRSRSRSRGRGHDYSRRRRYRSRNGSLSASYDSSPRRRERIEWKSVSRSLSDSRSSRSASPRSRDSSKKGRASDRTASRRKQSRAEHADSQLTAAERVKLKIKAQLSQAVSKESSQGKDANWERFDFNKTAPLDDDSEEDHSMDHTAVDDTAFLKNLGTTFSASLAQANRETQIKAAHEAAIFGVPVKLNARNENEQEDSNLLETGKNHESVTGHESKVDEIHAKGNILQNTLVSEQVRNSMQPGLCNAARIMERSCSKIKGTKESFLKYVILRVKMI